MIHWCGEENQIIIQNLPFLAHVYQETLHQVRLLWSRLRVKFG